ncbi:MAG: hypothetical protein ACT4QE_25100 [Anaerolineales bacterium]
MPNPNRLWFLLNWQAWAVLIMAAVASIIVREPWLITIGIFLYLVILLMDVACGGSLGRSGAVRLARAEQENRELRAEQARLVGAVNELQAKVSATGAALPASAATPVSEPSVPPVNPPV